MFDFDRIQKDFRGFKVIGDIHGEMDMFAPIVRDAIDRNLFIVSLGDLTDRGPASDEVLDFVMDFVSTDQMMVIVGNHDDKLWRHLNGNGVKIAHGLDLTLQQLNAHPNGDALAKRFHKMMPDFPVWATMGDFTFAHGSFHPAMLDEKVVRYKDKKGKGKAVSRAFYGQVDGFKDDGMPIRVHDWVDTIPTGHTVFVGHEVVGDEVLTKVGVQGGKAVFVDTGAGKGGVLSSVDVLF